MSARERRDFGGDSDAHGESADGQRQPDRPNLSWLDDKAHVPIREAIGGTCEDIFAWANVGKREAPPGVHGNLGRCARGRRFQGHGALHERGAIGFRHELASDHRFALGPSGRGAHDKSDENLNDRSLPTHVPSRTLVKKRRGAIRKPRRQHRQSPATRVHVYPEKGDEVMC